MKHRLLIDWLWWIPVVLYGFDMVPTKVELTGTITNIIDWTTEVTNFNLDYQAVGYSPFTTTNPNRTIVWTLTVLPIICSSDRNQGGNIPKAVLLASICSIPATNAMPPNIHADYDIVPGMKITWDGIPINDFLEEFMRPLDMGLGQIVQDGFSLLSCIRGSDAAGYDPLTAQPHFAVASNQQRNQHGERNKRAFACIMNRIDPLCEPYHEMMTLFNNDGIGAYYYIAQEGDLPYTPDQLDQFDTDWKNMNIYTLEREHMITINFKALFVLCGIIRRWSRRLRKTKDQERTKFLDAIKVIPSMAGRINNEIQTPNGTWRFRPNYALNYPANIRGTPHPFAGQPDIYKIARGLNGFWLQGIRDGSIKKTPKGFVNAAVVYDTVDNVFIVRQSSVTEKTQCFFCGGFGHAAVTIQDNGDAVECASKALKVNVSKDFLCRISYPDGVPNRITGPSNKKPVVKKAHYTDDSTKEDMDKDIKSDVSDGESSSSSSTSSSKSADGAKMSMNAALKAFAMSTGMSANDMKKAFKKRDGKQSRKHRSKH